MGKLYIGIDNGATGTIGFIDDKGWYDLVEMPVKYLQDYHRTATEICRVDHAGLAGLLLNKFAACAPTGGLQAKVLIERPFSMQYAVKAMLNGRRALEAVLIVLEQMHLPHEFIDSKEWQSGLLPKVAPQFDKKGRKMSNSAQLKRLSWSVGQRLFPTIDEKLFKDFDGLLIAEYLRRRETGLLGRSHSG